MCSIIFTHCVGHYLLFQGKYHHCRIQTLHLIFFLWTGEDTECVMWWEIDTFWHFLCLWCHKDTHGNTMEQPAQFWRGNEIVLCECERWSHNKIFVELLEQRVFLKQPAELSVKRADECGCLPLWRYWLRLTSQEVISSGFQSAPSTTVLIFKTENPILSKSSCLAFSSTIRVALLPYAEEYWSKDFELCIFVQLCSDWWH